MWGSANGVFNRGKFQAGVKYLHGGQRNAPVYPTDFTNNKKRRHRQQAACFEEDGFLFHCPKTPDAGIKRRKV